MKRKHVDGINMNQSESTFDRLNPYNALPDLPPGAEIETRDVMKRCLHANKLLAELKGLCQTLPDPHLLLNTIVLQESKASSEIENIVTTQDELYKATLDEAEIKDAAIKEVIRYREAIYSGIEQMRSKGLITTNLLVNIMQVLKHSQSGIRNIPGTKLANPLNGTIVYTPPEGEELIRQKLAQLELFMNDEQQSGLDPLIKMALIHYQLEAIHPFADGNGRTGRILNILYIMQQNLLGFPVLYLSNFIIRHKADYYRLLRNVTEQRDWISWITFMLNAVAETSALTLQKITGILALKKETSTEVKRLIKSSKAADLADLIFSYPYIKIKTLERHGIAKRQTASVYLQELAGAGILRPLKIGKEIYYVNRRLMNILAE